LLGKTPTPGKYDPTLIQQSGRLNPAQIDEMQMRNATDSAFQTGASGLSEASGGSGSALRAGLSGLPQSNTIKLYSALHTYQSKKIQVIFAYSTAAS
jgi:hypothetical protein